MKSPYDVIVRPLVTEDSMMKAEEKTYVFEVAKNSNKIEIRNAIEKIFNVKVASVNTMNVRGKKKRMGQNVGKRPDWKKAIVQLTEDSNEIELFAGM